MCIVLFLGPPLQKKTYLGPRELMLDSPEQIEAMFPKLDGGQIARRATFGRQQNAPALEIILERGDSRHGIFVVLSGSIE